jgi:hypothetical protein
MADSSDSTVDFRDLEDSRPLNMVVKLFDEGTRRRQKIYIVALVHVTHGRQK